MTMKIAFLGLLLFVAACSGGQDGTALRPAQTQTNHLARFDALFLSDTPLRYQDCHSLLSWLDSEAHLDAKEHRWVCSKLRDFLKRKTARPVAPDSDLTGIAPPEAILRYYAVYLLGKFGATKDIPFLEEFAKTDESTLPEGLRHGGKRTICADSIKKIRERDSANKVPEPSVAPAPQVQH